MIDRFTEHLRETVAPLFVIGRIVRANGETVNNGVSSFLSDQVTYDILATMPDSSTREFKEQTPLIKVFSSPLISVDAASMVGALVFGFYVYGRVYWQFPEAYEIGACPSSPATGGGASAAVIVPASTDGVTGEGVSGSPDSGVPGGAVAV